MLPPPIRVQQDARGEVREYETLASTQSVAADLVRDGVRGILAIRARHQTAGRGRQGGTWHDRPGDSLLVTYLVSLGSQWHHRQMAFAAGVAAAEAISAATRLQAGLKWPNDIVVGGTKVGGVLVEVVDEMGLFGIGINVVGPTPFGGAATLCDHGATAVSSDRIEAILREGLLDALQLPWDALSARWMALDCTAGRRYTAMTADGPVEGTAEGVTADGLLVLRTPSGLLATASASARQPQLPEEAV